MNGTLIAVASLTTLLLRKYEQPCSGAAGNRLTMADGTGTTTYTYDAVDQTTEVVNPLNKTVSYRYDARGLREGMTDPDSGQFTYTHDPVGRFESVLDPDQGLGSRLTTFVYDAAGQFTERRASPLAFLSTTMYDPAGRQTYIFNGFAPDRSNSEFTYAYDKVGNRLNVLERGCDRVTWTYDNTYQLTNEHRSGANAYNVTHTHDPVGNRMAKDDSGSITTYAYDGANQISTSQDAVGTSNYVYDGAGNLATVTDPASAITTSVWDDENRRTLAQLPSGVINTSIYNGEGLRVEKQDSGGTTKFIWDFQNYLAELDETDTTKVLSVPSLSPRCRPKINESYARIPLKSRKSRFTRDRRDGQHDHVKAGRPVCKAIELHAHVFSRHRLW